MVVKIEPVGKVKGNITLLSTGLCPRDTKLIPLSPRLPLNLVYLATSLTQSGYCVYIHDLQLFDIGTDLTVHLSDLVLQMLESISTQIVGISCMSDMLPFVLLALKKWKPINPKSYVILGGTGPSSVSNELLEVFSEVDVIVKGEGEQTIVELLDAYYTCSCVENIAGIVYREGEQTVENPTRPRITGLDSLMPLNYANFPLKTYYDALPISTARGCPFHCAFCSASFLWGSETTWHSIDSIVSILSELKQLGKERFVFIDDTFVLNRSRLQNFCDKILQQGPKVSWHCNGRINLMDDSLVIQMAKAGCKSIFYGIESGSSKILKEVQKGFTSAKALEVVLMTSQYLPSITTSFIWGFPNESWEDFQATRELYLNMNRIAQVSIQLYLLTPYPGIPLYKQYKKDLFFDLEIESNVFQQARPLEDEEIELIKQFPTLFSCFYRFSTPDLDRKLSIIEKDRKEIDSI